MDVSNVLNGVLNTVADESIKKPYREVKNLRSLRSNAACLREVIDRVKGIGDDIKTLLSGPGRQPKRVVRNWLNTQKRIVKSAEEVLQHRKVLNSLGNIDRHLKTKDSDFPTNGELGELPGALVQPVENELVGKFVHEKLQKLETWLLKDDSVRVVGVYGMPGVGKTSLLKHINNNEKGTFPAGEDQNMDSEIEPLVRSIAKECKGHPLAIKTLARTVPDLQNSTPSEWVYVLKQLKAIDPKFYRIHREIVEELFKRLNDSVLSWNTVEEVLESFLEKLNMLKVLDLSNTPIKFLPNSIHQLKHLLYLQLSNTQIKVIPHQTFELSRLQFLDLSFSSLKNIPFMIKRLKSLQTLKLAHCYDLEFVSGDISHLTSLEELDLWKSTMFGNSRDVRGGGESREASLQDVCKLHRLKHLRLILKSQIEEKSVGNLVELQELWLLWMPEVHQTYLPTDVRAMHSLERAM
ncbi:uncharacterized protein LOC131063272 [Cryptomeria japonica]|uniref:uncharacterized protein LOC131063272 n=1 Tax=Cryptomeria japonica TaxID=3369 RepID=UPI0027DA1B7A|nr:uncharacterized protein LOC131063272 [Cryptomeria japonica]